MAGWLEVLHEGAGPWEVTVVKVNSAPSESKHTVAQLFESRPNDPKSCALFIKACLSSKIDPGMSSEICPAS